MKDFKIQGEEIQKFQSSGQKPAKYFIILRKSSIYFPESGLINGLQAKGRKKIHGGAADPAMGVGAGLFVVPFCLRFGFLRSHEPSEGLAPFFHRERLDAFVRPVGRDARWAQKGDPPSTGQKPEDPGKKDSAIDPTFGKNTPA